MYKIIALFYLGLFVNVSFGQKLLNMKVINSKSNTYNFELNQPIEENDTLVLAESDYLLISINDSVYAELDMQGTYLMSNMMNDSRVKKNSNLYIRYVVRQIQNNNKDYIQDKKPFYRKPILARSDYVPTIKLPSETYLFGSLLTLKYAGDFFNMNLSNQKFNVVGKGILDLYNYKEDVICNISTESITTKIKLDTTKNYEFLIFTYFSLIDGLDPNNDTHTIINLSHADKIK